MTAPVLDVRDITKVYGQGDAEVHALRGVSLTVERGDYVAIMGASGSGKSTLMNILGCLDVPTSGRYLLDGIDVGRAGRPAARVLRNRKIGFVFQSFNLIPRMSALANVELPLAYGGVRAAERRAPRAGRAGPGRPGRPGRPRAEPALRRPAAAGRRGPGAGHRAGRCCSPTSRPATSTPSPPRTCWPSSTSSARSGRTIVLITHEDDVAAHAKRVIRLVDGRIVEDRRQAPVPTASPPRLAGGDLVSRLEILRFALRGLAANKLRSGLTMLGILIGVAAVILLVAVGNGSSQTIQKNIQRLGTNTLTISASFAGGGGGGGGFGGGGRGGGGGAAEHRAAHAGQAAHRGGRQGAGRPRAGAVGQERLPGGDRVLGHRRRTRASSHAIHQFVGTYPSYFEASNKPVAKRRLLHQRRRARPPEGRRDRPDRGRGAVRHGRPGRQADHRRRRAVHRRRRAQGDGLGRASRTPTTSRSRRCPPCSRA